MFQYIFTAALAFLFGLLASWPMRGRETMERALIILVSYLPLSLCAIVLGVASGYFQQRAFTEAVGFHALLAFECNAIAMLINFMSPRQKIHEQF